MATTEALERDADVGDGPVLVLWHGQSATERDLVEAWAREHHPGAEIRRADVEELDTRLQAGDDPCVIPVRVVWLPRERDGAREVRIADLLAMRNPHRPRGRLQKRIAAREPDRCPVVAGEGAHLSDMRTRWRTQSGTQGGARGLARFVGGQAELALARAEREVLGNRYKVPRLVTEQITASKAFRERLAKLADDLGRPFDSVLDDAASCLNELATVQSPLGIDVFRAALSPMHARAWDVDVDVDSLDRLRELNKRHQLVFLPSHRSYVDPLVLGAVMQEHDFPRNHILGGDNMSFWPIGPLGRRAGVIFIRRSFGDDKIYKLAVREFFGYLVNKRFNLEWYLEGGRTRTGKLRPPRYGLLHYLVTAITDGRGEDVILVPTSIAYDQLREVGAIAAEHGGSSKRSEGLAWLYDYVKAQSENVGTVQVRFGEPFSLRDAMAAADQDSSALEKAAFDICVGINRATPITPTSLVTLALLGVRDRALTLSQVRAVIQPLLDDVRKREVPGKLEVLDRPGGVERTLRRLADEGVVTCYDGGIEPVYSIEDGAHHVAAFYRNNAIHWFINRAILEVSLLTVVDSTSDDPLEEAWEVALRLRDLLKFEFFFPRKEEFRLELRRDAEFIASDWRDNVGDPDAMSAVLAHSGMLVAHRVLRSFLDAQLVVAERLEARDPRDPVDKKAFLDECAGVGRQMLLQGELHGPESVSRELFDSALQLAANRDLVDPGREELRERRKELARELRGVLLHVKQIGDLDAAQREEALGGIAR